MNHDPRRLRPPPLRAPRLAAGLSLWLLGELAAAPSPPPAPARAPLVKSFLEGPLANVEKIVFAARKLGPDGHWYANFGYYAEDVRRVTWRKGGKLLLLDVRSGKVDALVDDPEGGIRDPVVGYDARRILFSWRRGGTPYYHLWEIGVDGEGLRPVTTGPFDDIEPCWLPDGRIVFVSSRAKRWVNCWLTQVATLHVCDSDGGNIRPISSNNEHDNTPWVLPDGRIIYQRWEYVDRSQVHYHHLWTARPDGTHQMVYYGNQTPGTVMIDAKPVPGSDKVVAIFSPGHGRREHDGAIFLVDPEAGPDQQGFARPVVPTPVFRDPWAFSEEAFLAARGVELVLVDGKGSVETLHALSEAERKAGFQLHEPRPVIERPRERVFPSEVSPRESSGYVILSDVYKGRNMVGVKRGEIEKLLVMETLPKPINYTGGMDPLTYGGSFTLERVVGTVPVEPDGSAYVRLPALRSFFFVALDDHDLSVKRMQSFLTVQPGEVTSCAGCHEQRTKSIVRGADLMALRRPASSIEPVAGYPDVFDFPRDIQPVLDALCVDCHGYEKTERGGPRAGRLLLSGDHGPMFSHSYYMMTIRRLFSDGRNRPVSNYPPRAIGSSASRILKLIDGSHHGVVATERQRNLLRLWIEAGAPYPGTYAALGTGMIGGYSQNHQVHTDTRWPATRAGREVIERRCDRCHQRELALPKSLSDERRVSFWQPSWVDPRLELSRHIVFNLSRPERSLLLLAPLAKAAGGWELCREPADRDRPVAVFTSKKDADYAKLLAMVEAGRRDLESIGRFDMKGFRPRAAYVREMKRYGVLPADLSGDAEIDPYEVDRAYWRSLWYQPPASPAVSSHPEAGATEASATPASTPPPPES